MKHALSFTTLYIPYPYIAYTLSTPTPYSLLGHYLKERKVARSDVIISTKVEGYDWIDDYYGPGI